MAQDPYRYFRIEARELVDQLGKGLLDLEKGENSGELVAQLLRLAHTLKGAARVVRQPAIADHAHAIEDLLGPYRNTSDRVDADPINEVLQRIDQIAEGLSALSQPESARPAAEPQSLEVDAPKAAQAPDDVFRTLRTEVEEIDALLDGVSEVFARLNSLRDGVAAMERARHVAELLSGQLAARSTKGRLSVDVTRADRAQAMAEELRATIGSLERSLGSTCDRMGRELFQVRDIAEQLRLIPAGTLFTTLQRTARDAARDLGKRVDFEGKGGDVRLDGNVLRTVQDALVQVVRNAIAHGIESPTARAAAGKSATGTVRVSVERRARRVVFRCSDDGRGVDHDAVRKAALKQGVTSAALAALEADGILELLLRGGVSTSESVTAVSGRGIGMDVVRDSLAKLGGQVKVQTEAGRGATFELEVPLSIAAVDALVVESNGTVATIPLDSIRHAQRLSPSEVSRSAGGESIVFEDKALPLVQLSRALGNVANGGAGTGAAVVISGGSGLAAIGVDRLRGFTNVVVRALPDFAHADAVVAGASLDAEGNPQIVLDPDGLVAEALGAVAPQKESENSAVSILVVDDSLTTRMLEQSILESAGYQVDLASSGEEALEVVRKKHYALILVDVEMPGMDGFTFIEHIRADAGLREIPAILVTSLASPEHIKRGEDAGAQGYMIKSEFDQARLLARIKELAA